MSTLIAVLLAIPLGVIAALKQDTWVDYLVRIVSIAGLPMPSFWLGIVFILGLLIVFRWLPPMVYTPFWVDPWQNLAQLIWPALAVGYQYSAVATRMTRSAMLEVLREDYIRTARAKGLWMKLILVRHALKNAMLPVVAVTATLIAPYDPLAVDFGAMLRPPSAEHWLGTDAFGRDVLSRLIYGSRTALIVGFGAAFFGATAGAILGVASAYFGGRID